MRKLLCILACFALVGCGDPIADIARLSEQDLPDDAGTVEVAAVPGAQGGSLLERLLSDTENQPTPEADTTDTAAISEPQPEAKTTGLLAMLTRAAPPKQDVIPVTPEAQAVKVALSVDKETPQPETPALPATPMPELTVEKSKRKTLFGGLAANPKAAAPVSEIEPGTLLPYGKVARICGLPKRALGKEVAKHPEKRPKHRIYDSEPGNIAPHSFFITGFGDGCARQFTASLAMFGSVSMHEQLRYGLPSEVQPYSDTDKAYEKLKSKVCGVPRKKPCGGKVSKLDGNTVFVSIYERFGSNQRWTNLLLHDGDVLAQDNKGS